MQTTETTQSQVKLLAGALFEIRIQLASYLGSQESTDPAVRAAAHLAYALHNEALAVLEGHAFDEKAAVAKIEAVDRMFGENFSQRLIQLGARSDV